MTLDDISLGDFSAENDVNLKDYFLDETYACISAKNFNDHRYILLGRTGSGKSAILSHIHEKFRHDDNYICAFIRPNQSYLDAVVQTDIFHEFKKTEGLQPILYKLIWQYVIMVAVIREKYGHSGPRKKGRLLVGSHLKAYKFLNKVQELSADDKTLFDVIIDLIKEIKISLSGITITSESKQNSAYQIMRDLVKETDEFHKKGFWDVVGGKKLYLLFDDLDLGWNPDSEDQQLLLRGLFEIMKDFAYRERVKPLIARAISFSSSN
jgi:energy-coupling factor transporter ATP-binding protein EcfA2